MLNGQKQAAGSRAESRLDNASELPNLRELYQQANNIFRADQVLTRTSSNPLKIFPLSKYPGSGISPSPFVSSEVAQEGAWQGKEKVGPKKVQKIRREVKLGKDRSRTTGQRMARAHNLSPRSSSPQEPFKVRRGEDQELVMQGRNVMTLPG